MRFLGWVMGLALGFPASAPAQAVKRESIIGTWIGKAEYAGPERQELGALAAKTIRATFYPDGLFRYEDDPPEPVSPGEQATHGDHGSGRWRLSGDTLWWGTDARYGNDMIYTRGELPEGPITDTLQWSEFPANDSLFWTAPIGQRPSRPEGEYWHLTAYKISLKDERLTLVRIDDLSNNKWDPAGGVYERKKGKSGSPPPR